MRILTSILLLITLNNNSFGESLLFSYQCHPFQRGYNDNLES